MGSARLLLTGLSIAVVAVSGCTREQLIQDRIDRVRRVIDESKQHGAYRCAPRDLAIAVAQVEFSESELSQSDPARSEHHVEIAEKHARAAHKTSLADSCPADETPDPSYVNTPRLVAKGGESSDTGLACTPEERRMGKAGCSVVPEDSINGAPKGPCRRGVFGDTISGDREDCVENRSADDLPEKLDEQCQIEPGKEIDASCLEKYKNIEITDRAIRTKVPIRFQKNTASPTKESKPVLEEVLQLLLDNPKLSIEIQVHTDSRGEDAENLRRSQNRADAIYRFLISNGVGPSRLTARGYGETVPIESNQTSKGRAKNRRVEFIRTENSVVKEHTIR